MHRSLIVARRLLFPPRCVGCGRRQPVLFKGNAPDPLCAECRVRWEEETRQSCPDCFAPCYECTCLTPLLKRAGASALVRAAYYSERDEHRVARHTVLSTKHRPDRAALQFAAGELCGGVLAALAREGYRPEQAVLTHLPRSPRNRRRYGLDQAQELAKALAAHTGLAYRPLLLRKKDGKMQKTLSATAREKNLRNAFALLPHGDLPECVVLVDDIVTTGAGAAAATRALRGGGAGCVIVAAFAYTLRKKSSKQ